MDCNAKTQSPGILAMDILCSKDKSLSTHPGNRLFRQTIEEAIPHYAEALDKATKMKITKNIVECLHNEHGCRFVKFDADSASWVELSRIEARDKVGHALRFAIKGSNGKQPSRRRSSTAKKAKRKSSTASKRGSTRSSVSSQTSMSRTVATAACSRRPSVEQEDHNSFVTATEDEVQAARHNLDQIFERQQQILKALHMLPASSDEEDAPDACFTQEPEIVSLEPLDLDSTHEQEAADFFSAGELDFLTNDHQQQQETHTRHPDDFDDSLWDFVEGIVSL